MFILENVPLSNYSTMRLGGIAAYLTEVTSKDDLRSAIAWAGERNLPIIMIGGGSNIIWKDEGFSGLVLVNKLMGFEVFSEDEENAYITIGAGENWDSVVERAVETGKSGVECLSLIPGTSGGAPVQNIGAYGHELSEVLVSVEAYDLIEGRFVNIQNSDCGFGYRTSRFKFGPDKGRFLITAITIHLTSQTADSDPYHRLDDYMKSNNIENPKLSDIRTAVISLRNERLPDPNVVANNGSFFANPIVDSTKYHELLDDHPRLAGWPSKWFWELPEGQYKIAAGALLEYLGFKDFHDQTTGMATWPKQALVFVNEQAKSTNDLITFKQMISDKVQSEFGITLEQEPEILP